MSRRVLRAMRFTFVVVVTVGIGTLPACSSFLSNGTPSSVVPGTSLTQFQNKVAVFVRSKIGGTPGSDWVTGYGNVSVQCALPASWIAGTTFSCYAYLAETASQSQTPTDFGTVTVTVLSTQPGYKWNANFAWLPG